MSRVAASGEPVGAKAQFDDIVTPRYTSTSNKDALGQAFVCQ
jgi:hypothetical protein